MSVDQDWIPTAEGTSLYIRPFIFATEAQVGVHPAQELLFAIILSPVGAYYPEGLNPVKIYVEDKYVRAVRGGMGYTKTGGNYAASLKAQDEAEKVGYTQVLWLDGVERKYIEEVGTMNVFFVIDDAIVTPELQGSILPGVTRMSCIELLKKQGYKVSERRLSIEEVAEAADAGKLKEAFGSGTAAVISPIGELKWDEKVMTINNGEIGTISQHLYDTLTGIQWGKLPDPYGRRIITQDCRYGFRQIVSVCRCTSLIEYHLQLGPSSRKVHHRFAKVFPELTVQPSGTNYHMLATYSHDLLLTPQFCHTIHTGWRTLLILLAGHIVRLFAKHIIRRDLPIAP